MKKLRKSRVLAVLLAACLLIGVLPSEMLGGIARVSAAEATAAEKVTYNQSGWTVSTGDSSYEYRTTSWDFTTAGLTKSETIDGEETVKSIGYVKGTVQLKKNVEGLSMGDGGAIKIPLDGATVLADVSFQLTSLNPARWLTIGEGTTQKVYHSAGHADKTIADGALDSTKSFSSVFDSKYFSGASLQIASSGGESKLGTLTLIETRPATGGSTPSVTEIAATVSTNDLDSLLQPGDKITLANNADDKEAYDITTAEGMQLTLKANAAYNLVSSNSDIKAVCGSKTSITTGTEAMNLVVDLESTVVNPVVTISDQGNLLDTATLTLTNQADTTEVHTLTNAAAVKLKIGAKYTIACSSSAVVALIAGSKTLTAAADMTAFTVDITAADTSKHTYDVWDLGAEQLANTDTITYNNKLTADIINSWYPGVAAGTKGTSIPDNITLNDANGQAEFVFLIGPDSSKGKHRLRSTNASLTRYDDKSLTSADQSIVCKGYLYSNARDESVGVQLAVKAGDKVTFMVGSNGTDAVYTWKSPNGKTESQDYSATNKVQQMTFYAAEDGLYTLYCSVNEKLVVARILRERPTSVTVSGAITAPVGANLSNAKIVFTNTTTGQQTEVSANGASYSATLQEQYSYDVSLTGANGYIIGADNQVTIANEAGATSFPVEIINVSLLDVTGSLADLTAEAAANLELTFTSENVYVPEYTINPATATYSAKLEKGVTYTVQESGVNDYTLDTTSIVAQTAGTQAIHFTKKPVYAVNAVLEGPSVQEAQNAVWTFENINEEGYTYTFTGTNAIALRDGQYKVTVTLDGYNQMITSDVKVNGAAVSKTVQMVSTAPEASLPYKAAIRVAADGDYQTINDALAAVRRMERTEEQRVTISIAPGNYEEMLVIDTDNVTLKNESTNPSIELTDKGVNIAPEAVRVTSYYGHGYTYYSMGDDCKYNEALLQANKENGYASFENPGSGTTSGSYWNATVVIDADGFQAEGIIFENSFNQYMSAKAAADVIVKQSGAKEGSVARASMEAGDVTVQNKAYVERAAALAIYNNRVDINFENCKFVGRQDTLYGGKGTYAEFNECSVYGGTDYIFGGMTAIFNKCDLVFNTSEDKNDVGYITAAQQTAGRGYLMYECHVTSTVPGVDTASAYTSKPGYFGRPWAANTSEVVFYNTTVDAADAYWENAAAEVSKTNGKSLIEAEGWNNSLSGTSAGMYEYGTVEQATDYTPARAEWATLLTEPVLADGTAITLEAFRRVLPVKDLYEIDLSQGLKAGQVYDGGVAVVEDMAYKAVTGDTISGTVYTGYVAGGNNPKTDGTNAAGSVPDTGSALKLTAEKDGKIKIAVKINSGKTIYFVSENGSVESYTNSGSASEFAMVSYDVEAGNTYYFYGNGTKVPMYAITVDYRDPMDWNQIAAPVLGTPVVNETDGTIEVPFTAQIGGIYADSLEVRMIDSKGEIADSISYAAEASDGSVTFAPSASGSYTFQGVLRRSGMLGKNSNVTDAVAFVLPMRTPVIINVENQGAGTMRFSWKEVSEAESYNVYLNGEKKGTTTKSFYRFENLTVGEEYTFGVEAVRGSDVSARAEQKQTVTQEAKKSWSYAAFGSGVDTKNNSASGSVDENTLTLQSQGGKGKLVPASTDGLAFYYTTIDPETENFTLSADVTVDKWTYSNGQEGFGIMAADNVGTDGDSGVFWNNSYMASVTKVEYYWDSAAAQVSDSGRKYTMKLGVGAQEKIGVTPENIADETTVNYFSSKMTALDTYCAQNNLNEGTYNIAGNYTNKDVDMGDVNLQTTFHMTIQRNNTGYFVSYTDAEGNTTTKKYYHGDEGDELTKLDENNIYVGFFASRYATIQVRNVELTTVKPEMDAPAEERPVTYVTPNYTIESASTANAAAYELVYYGNADGTLTITNAAGEAVVANQKVTAATKVRTKTTLALGKNAFTVEFTPDAGFKPSKYELLSSYDTKKFTFTVDYKAAKRNNVYISPSGTAAGDGSRENPMDIYTAVKYAAAGQKLILMEGTYSLSSTVTIDRGIDGTADSRIYMMADPQAAGRPVLDFQRKCAGMVMAGDYWYFQGFDVTNSSNGQKGIQVSGNNNILDDLFTYRNGNTGIQISRFKGTDLWEDWPADNLILNCTSYLNADAGYEDADGFAAKLTIADGNVFDGCIAAYNADDGWDLFAKVESGPIGQVTIRNCVTFKNGYVLDADGKEVNAGNGNGFKMGGSSISGKHLLENSISFANKSKGIDSNSCPDIQVKNSTSYNNESFNVAFYTNDEKNTDFYGKGILSYKDANTVAEQIKLRGTQDESKVYDASNYFFNGKASQNTAGVKVSADWFESLDSSKAGAGISRNADGTICMNGFLELTSAAPENAGARMTGTPSQTIVVGPDEVVADDPVQTPEPDAPVITPKPDAPVSTPVPGTEDNDDDDDDDDADDADDADDTPAAATTAPPTTEKVNSTSSKPAAPKKDSVSTPVTPTENKKTDAKAEPVVVEAKEGKITDEVIDAVKEILADTETAGEKVIQVELTKSTELPAELLDVLKGKDVSIELKLDNGVSWVINGKDIQNSNSIDLSVELNTEVLPTEQLETLAGDNETIQFSLAHDGEFGFTAEIRIPVDSKLNGKYGNVFYVHDDINEYVGSAKVEKGMLPVTLSHASDYVIVFADEVMDKAPEAPAETITQESTTTAESQSAETPAETKGSNSPLTIILIILAVLVIGGVVIAFIVPRRKKDD